MSEMQDELKGRFDAYVTMNGQLCFDAEGTYRDAHIDDGDVRVLVEQAREGLYDLYVMQGVRSFVNHRGPLVEELGRQVGLEYELGSLDMAFELPVYQFNVFGGPEVEDVFLSKTEPRGGDALEQAVLRRHPRRRRQGLRRARHAGTLRYCAGGGSGVRRRRERPVDVRRGGNERRDGNAWDIVKERASHITTDVDDDGIWNACVELRLV